MQENGVSDFRLHWIWAALTVKLNEGQVFHIFYLFEELCSLFKDQEREILALSPYLYFKKKPQYISGEMKSILLVHGARKVL